MNPYRDFIPKCECLESTLGAIFYQQCKKDVEINPAAHLSQSPIQAEQNYKMFNKQLLAIVASFKELRNYLEGNPNSLDFMGYTNHFNIESPKKLRQLTQ